MKRKQRYCAIGGQAVMEGVMMKRQDSLAIALRRADGSIHVKQDGHKGFLAGLSIASWPLIRGVVNFVDSLILGNKCLNYSISMWEEGEDKSQGKIGEKILPALITLISIVLALGMFVVLPYYLASLSQAYIRNRSLVAILEGVLRIGLFILYVWAIGRMQDIRRLYQYHGAEHKCINCIERGRELTVENVMRSSRLHKRCGTSFIFFVLMVSIVLFFFIRVDSIPQRVLLRIALMPVVAALSYELIRLAGRFDNVIVNILSAPGMLVQKITTKEPDREMVEVAIAAVEAVFDWRAFQREGAGELRP